MDAFSDSVLGTIRKLKEAFALGFDEGEGREAPTAVDAVPDPHHSHHHLLATSEDPARKPSHPATSEESARKPSHPATSEESAWKHSRQHPGQSSLSSGEDIPTVKEQAAAPNYQSCTKGKESTLLKISKHDKDNGPNSETCRRTRSMRMAHSLGSVYRKLQTDKNIHNDRHYLVAVTEHLKEDIVSDLANGRKGTNAS